ncbi:SNARE protein [Erysiphe neolycopersici]|uniref:SNARE protein n=1 Tax=Erysiphe neolycopersici TaxID=212602 RepID=A0A420I304_9PEZI|nr:SNARE protein [Erysiphe neolycopersici]
MSEAYELERQNNSRLSELSAKVTALRGITVDIYDNARAQNLIDDTLKDLNQVDTNFCLSPIHFPLWAQV